MNTIGELLNFRANTHPERNALFFEDRTLNYWQIKIYSLRAANFLKSFSIQKGQRFCILDFNTEETLHLLNGACFIGAIPVILNWRLTPGEMKDILEDSNSLILFYGKEFREIAQEIKLEKEFSKAEINLNWIESFSEEFSEEVLIEPEDIYIHLYTSGTTGLPKGIPLSHKNILSVVRNLAIELPGFGADSVNLVCAPFFHIGGVGYSMLGFFIGAENILVRKFEPNYVQKIMIEKKITNALLVPAMIGAILNLKDIEKSNFTHLRNIQHGGSPMPEELLRKASQIFKCDFTHVYGLTETSGISCLLRYDDIRIGLSVSSNEQQKRRLSSVGKASPEMKLIIKLANGNIAQQNELGEVCIQGEYLFNGYWNRPEINLQSFDQEGWFHTGDIGLIDENGYLYLYDRKNDMILSKSENIYPIEIERILSAHPQIFDLAIVGLPDDEYGEIVTAFVALKQGAEISLNEMKEFLKDKLASYKIPRKLIIVNEIPRNPSGKILRKELKRKYY